MYVLTSYDGHNVSEYATGDASIMDIKVQTLEGHDLVLFVKRQITSFYVTGVENIRRTLFKYGAVDLLEYLSVPTDDGVTERFYVLIQTSTHDYKVRPDRMNKVRQLLKDANIPFTDNEWDAFPKE